MFKESQNKIIKNSLLILLAVFVFSSFKELIEKNWNDILIGKIFNYFNNNTFSDSIFLFLIASIPFYLLQKKRVKFLPPDWIIIFINLIYFYYRFFDKNELIFISLFNSKIYYFDLIPFISLSFFYGQFLNKPIDSKIEKIDKPAILSDIPSENDDFGGRNELAELLVNRILNINNNNKTSVGIGISGVWGSGKTSFLNIFKTKANGKFDILEFNPWLYNVDRPLEVEFFNELKIFITNIDNSFEDEVDDYIENFVNVEFDWISKTLSFLKGILIPAKSVANTKNSLGNKLKNLQKKIIILIDDIDRLDKSEIINVLKIIRTSANLPNLFFIVTYDKDYVLNILSHDSAPVYGNYLDKFFQLEIPLPKFERDKLFKKLKEELFLIIDESTVNFSSDLISSDEFMHFFETERDIVRYCNNLINTVNLIDFNELEIQDLLVLEIFKLKYPFVYEKFWKEGLLIENEFDFFSNNNGDLSKNQPEENDLLKGELLKLCNNNTKAYDLFCALKLRSFHRSKNVFDLPNNLMKNANRISKASSHDRYFAQRLLDSDISEVEFGNNRKNLNSDELSRYFINYNDNKQEKLMFKILNIRFFDNYEEHLKIFKALYSFTKIKREKDFHRILDYFNFEENVELCKIYSIEIFEREFLNLLNLDFFKDAIDGYFLIELAYYAKNHNSKGYYTELFLKNIKIKVRKIMEDVIINKSVSKYSIKIELFLEDAKLIKRFISENLEKYLKESICFYKPRGYSFFQFSWHSNIFEKNSLNFAKFLITECNEQKLHDLAEFIEKYEVESTKAETDVHILYGFDTFQSNEC